MMAADLLFYTGAWVIYIFAQSAFILGIHAAAKGETEILPNGEEKDSNMILYPIYKWLHEEKTREVAFQGDQLYKLLNHLMVEFKDSMTMPHDIRKDGMMFYKTDTEFQFMITIVGERLKSRGIFVSFSTPEKIVLFYKKYPVYKRSKWLRMPTLGCIKCMPSYWSLLTYWLPMVLVFGYHDWMWLLWIASVPSVTFINTYLSKKY